MPSNASKSERTRKPCSKDTSCTQAEMPATGDPVAAAPIAGKTNGFDVRPAAKSNGAAGESTGAAAKSNGAAHSAERTPLRALRSIQKLLDDGRRKGFLTLDDINRGLPDDVLSSEQLDDVLRPLRDPRDSDCRLREGAGTEARHRRRGARRELGR